jgi:CubicO group peptidase (beta-lactamase class C family)
MHVDQGRNPGIAAAVITPEGTYRAIAGTGGPTRIKGPRPEIREDTLFEIGSLTKLVTGTLFSNSVRRGEVREDDYLLDVFPDLKLPNQGDRITLLDLATHRSGMPRSLPNYEPEDPTVPYKNITKDVVIDRLAKMEKLNYEPGTQTEYSNIGAGILGQALVLRSGLTDFETLVQERFCKPLGLNPVDFTTQSSSRIFNPELPPDMVKMANLSHTGTLIF